MNDQSKFPEKKTRLMIVDDLLQVRQGLASVLKLAASATRGGIEIIGEAQNGSEAVEMALSFRPDVVLMDLEMPILDGYEATRRIKQASPAIWIVALTIHGDQTARLKAGQAGVDAFVEKGAPLKELIQAIQERNS